MTANKRKKLKPEGDKPATPHDARTEKRKELEAATVTSSAFAAYMVIAATEGIAGASNPDLVSMAKHLNAQSAAVIGGDMTQVEAMLISQATALQSLFARLAERGMGCDHVQAFESNMRMALRAQSQCRATLETLAAIKNPPIVYAKQANFAAGHQQVNNGITSPAQAREIENEQTQLLEDNHGERMDGRTAGTASSTDKAMATLGKINRAEDRGR